MNPRPAVLIAAIAALVLPGCMKPGQDAGKGDSSDDKASPLVRVASVRRRSLDRVLEISGAVEALTYVQVHPRIEDAEILEIRADVGDRVAVGDVLAVFDPTDARMILDETRVSHAEAVVQEKNAAVALRELQTQAKLQRLLLEQAQKQLERARLQAEKGAISQEQLDTFQYRRDQEAAQVERVEVQIEKAAVAVELAKKSAERAALTVARAERKVSWATLRAPIGGVVARRQAAKGQQTLFTSLARGALFELFDPGSLVVNAQVTQRDLTFVQPGLRVEIRSDACPGVAFDGSIAVVAPSVDVATGTVPIRVAIKEQGNLKPGVFVSGRIVIEAKADALVVPRKAVLYERERPYVMKIAGGGGQPRVGRVYFREGLSDKDEVECLAGPDAIGDGDRIVLVGHDRLRDGDAVEIEKSEGGGPAESRSAAASRGG